MNIIQKMENFPRKYNEGFTLNELEELMFEFPALNLIKFKTALNGTTCMEMNSELIIYKKDVLKALQLGLNIIQDNSFNWD